MTDIRDELAEHLRQFGMRFEIIAVGEGAAWLQDNSGDLPPYHATIEKCQQVLFQRISDAALAWFRAYLQREEVVERAAKATFAEYVARDPSCPLLSWDDAPGWERAMWKRRQVAALAAILPEPQTVESGPTSAGKKEP